MRRFIKTMAVVLALAGLVVAGLASFHRTGKDAVSPYQMSSIKRGDLKTVINATGTLEPEEVIDVGAQVAGRIISFGKDKNGKPIDYGSYVEEGTVLARIDESLYVSDVDQANASMAQAKANLARAEADLGQLSAKLEQAGNDWKRAEQLGPSDALSQSSYDAYKAAYETAKANLAVGQATVEQNRGLILQAQAALTRAQRNLGYCTIVSPVNGVIIDRRVNIGQTVVASLNAPSLFLIAKDLRRMQVWVSVNEADIANIHPGQRVTFTVDAHPGQTFEGRVGKIRLNASMTQNVVTYTVEVTTDNSKRVLLPYLTANVQFEVVNHPDVLMVPSAALKWTPKPEQIDPAHSGEAAADFNEAGDRGSLGNQGHRGNQSGILWVTAENGLRPIRVRTGLSDGIRTEVDGSGLKEGLNVVIGENRPDSSAPSNATANPFTPQLRGRQRGGPPH